MRTANAYFCGTQLNDEGNRIENSALTTNNVPTPPGPTRIRDRRCVAIDPQRGLAFTFVFFDPIRRNCSKPRLDRSQRVIARLSD